jgi:PsbN protein
MEWFLILINPVEPATVLSISVAAVLLAVTGYSVYMSFGPPSKQLADPFDDHED